MKVKLYRDSREGGNHLFYRRIRKGNKTTWEECWLYPPKVRKCSWRWCSNPFNYLSTEKERREYIQPSSDLEFVLLVGHAPDQVEKI